MADQPKTYAVGISAKQKTFSSGTSIIKLGVNVKKFVAFLNEHVNEAGYVNLGVSERREVGQYGETHSVWLDTWKPDGEKPKQRDAVAEAEGRNSVLIELNPQYVYLAEQRTAQRGLFAGVNHQ